MYLLEELGLEPPQNAEPVKVVQQFPVVWIPRSDEFAVPPREWGSLVTTPEPQRLLAA